MATVRFTKYGSNTMVGSFGPGDLMRCSEAMANHLVNEAQVAEYVNAPSPVKPEETEQQPKPRQRRK